MRKWVPLLLTAVLLPVFAAPVAAQEKGDPQRPVSRARAVDIALATVGAAVQRGELRGSWLPPGIQVARLSGTVVKTLDAWNGQPVYLVAVTAPKGSGHVRVVVNARNGKTLDSRVTGWDWGNAPAWWQAGQNSPPPARR